MTSITGRDRLLLAAVAFGGTLAAHALAYSLIAPDPHVHSTILRATGHGVWTLVTALAVALAAGLGPGCIFRTRQKATVAGGLLPRLVIVQSTAFIATEAIERLAVGVSLDQMIAAPVVVGILLQFPIALALSWLVKLVAKVSSVSVGEGTRLARSDDLVVSLPVTVRFVATAPEVTTTSPRGPPLRCG